jgi:hypothetical protein
MDDILSQGGDREPSRWPRRLAVIGAPILVAVASIIWLSLARHSHSPAAAPPTSLSTGAASGRAGSRSADPQGRDPSVA